MGGALDTIHKDEHSSRLTYCIFSMVKSIIFTQNTSIEQNRAQPHLLLYIMILLTMPYQLHFMQPILDKKHLTTLVQYIMTNKNGPNDFTSYTISKDGWSLSTTNTKKMLDNGLKQYTVFFGVVSVFERNVCSLYSIIRILTHQPQ